MSDSQLTLDTAGRAPSVASNRPSPITGLTTFPNPFADEPEQGILPAFLSKVKSTFSTASTGSIPSVHKTADKGSSQPTVSAPEGGGVPSSTVTGSSVPQTEAQAIAAAAKERALSGKQITPIPTPILPPGNEPLPPSGRPSPTIGIPPSSPTHNRTLRAPIGTVPSTSAGTQAPSVASSSRSDSQARSKRLFAPSERHWRPSGAAPAQVTVSPVTSVTTTVQAPPSIPNDSSSNLRGSGYRSSSQFGLQAAVAGSSRQLSHLPHAHVHHAHRDSLTGLRPRRSSFATIPDSPSSISLSAMIAANAELSQNVSFVPGFPLPQDDTRSVRSLGFVKRTNSVSKIIRRIRGEGLSKHYWMADEHCKECYDCKSVFTAWRRKHHCRICGQIFCSRCASNIIGARRFGQDGAVRVCNLCLRIMEEYKDDDDDDRRSIASVSTSARHPSISDRAFLNATLSPEMPYAKSPFAASQLFASHPDDTLGAIDEGSVPTRWGVTTAEDVERPYTPLDGSQGSDEDDEAIWTLRPNTAAPFRRPMDDEQSAEVHDTSQPASAPESPALPSPNPGEREPPRGEKRVELALKPEIRRVEFPRTDTMSTDGLETRVPLGGMDSNQPLIGLRTRLSSRASQGGLTALLDTEKAEGLWRARSHSFAQARPELLSGASLKHFEVMLEQAIARADLPNQAEWHRVLNRILLKVSTNVNPNVRAGDSIDVRAYVKIKKVPGGKISDSEYVDGIVISKNVAHKAMPRRLVNPRIMVLTFPLDYHRVETQFMSLDPILAQEKDYLRLLTRRIIDVRPHIVLVERSASRIALDYLLEANIAVARSVKLSAIHQVARCTQADVVASMDRLALEPRLGRCAEFRLQSFEHDLIPGRRKTLMRFEGCHRDYGCTIILRGGDLPTLRKVKVIADFMSLVVYQLKNEVIMYNDEHNILPPQSTLPADYQQLLDILGSDDQAEDASDKEDLEPESPITPTPGRIEDERQLEKREAKKRTREIALSLEPYLTTALSASAAIRFPPPVPLARMAMLDQMLATLRHNRDEEEAAEILQEETKAEPTIRIAVTEPDSVIATITAISEASESTMSSAVSSSTAMSLIPATAPPSKTRDPYRVLRRPEEIARESTLAQVEHDHEVQLRLWQWYVKRHPGQLRPEDYQGIVYLYSLGCEGADKPCVEPQLQHINFYQSDDLTLGQFLENLAVDAVKRCPSKTCERHLLFHFRLLVHGDRRLQIAMDQFPCPSPGHEDQIITWSYCRLCATPSPTTIMREETWKMSWGAYLEHCFYPPETRAGFTCPHDAYRDQIRYFAHRNLAIRIHNEKIDLYEPLRPSISLQYKAETKVVLKNLEYESALQKNAAFFDSVLFRLRSFDYDIVEPDKVALLKTALENMLSRATADREEMVNLLNRTYKLTPMIDVLALNTVLRTLQDKVVQWDSDFADVEKAFMPSEKDLRRMTATHLKRLFANQDVFNTLDRNVAGLTVSEVDEKETKAGETDETTPLSTEPATPMPGESPDVSCSSSQVDLVGSEGITPLAGVMQIVRNPLSGSGPPSPGEYDSDSTVGAAPRRSPLASPGMSMDRLESSEMDSDAHAFVSRLPRRSKPAPSIADLVKRFQESAANHEFEGIEEPPFERPRSSNSLRRLQNRQADPGASDSDDAKARPRLRRGRTEQPPSRHRDVSRPGLMSDGDRSYAANASRIPSTLGRRLAGGSDTLRPPARTRTAPSPATRSRRPSPEGLDRLPPGPPARPPGTPGDGKPRLGGKGKMPRAAESHVASRNVTRRAIPGTPGSSRVSSIARHFDRLSREAERERQKRISAVRGKRARPVAVTKAKVQVFNNVRDAFKDEFDTDSSEADNEEDDMGSDDSADSNGEARPRRKTSSPTKQRPGSPVKSGKAKESTPTPPMPVSHAAGSDSLGVAGNEGAGADIAASAATSALSDFKSEMSFTDRLQIELPSFETSAPLPSVPVTPQHLTDTADEAKAANFGQVSQISQMSESEMSSGGERSSILKTLTGLWAFRAGDYTPLEYPLSASEHIFADSRVIIRENEPTSIVAFTLSSKTYRDKMRNVASQTTGRKVEAFMPEDGASVADRSSVWDIVSLDEAIETDDPSRREGGTHLKYDFESGSSTIFCRIFFAEQFAALRSACQCEDSFVESLARCVQFDASGGKSGSAFLKTKDDRFIAKEISRLEMDALTKFAPAYFEYTRKAFQGQRPTVLAKIYGFFKIGYRNAITGRSMRMNVLVMENLFYERRFSKIYDLKGSTRNRLIQPTGRVNEVLLDENLMELVYKHPLYLREHSKRILRTALFNDTLFLSNLNVMDYSLVVGVDSEKHELVVGIVDYIRTFTWDKKLESWVKDSAFLGGAGKGEPTIVTPKQYKARFRAAMERFYFPSVPDRWTKIGAEEPQPEEESSTSNA